MAWTLSDLRTQVRDLTGRSSTGELSDAAILVLINDYYRYKFPQAACLDRFDTTWKKTATATDSGEYSDDNDGNSLIDVIELKGPIFANGLEMTLVYDADAFWSMHPPSEEYLIAPALALGTTNAAHVANGAFSYLVSDSAYSKAAAETALDGETVPQSKYGAWQLIIDADGDITVQEADDNATGYATAARAIRGLPAKTTGTIVMGFVTAINTAGTFIPGTTELSAAGVTDTYTDGNWRFRGQPQYILLHRTDGKVYIRPKANDTTLIQSMASMERPVALAEDTDTPIDQAWGRALAVGASIEFLVTKESETERIAELTRGFGPTPAIGSLDYELHAIRMKYIKQLSGGPMRSAI